MHRNRYRPPTILFAGLLAATLAGAPAAFAEPPGGSGMGMHAGSGMHGAMGMGGMGGGMGGHGKGKAGHGFAPHNAAVHFIQMADLLGLDAGQIERLQGLRDAWIAANSAKQARLRAAEADLKRLLFATDIDMQQVEAKLAAIGQLEGPLWRDFARQLKDIKDMLSDEQKARLRQRHRGRGM